MADCDLYGDPECPLPCLPSSRTERDGATLMLLYAARMYQQRIFATDNLYR